MLDFSGAQFNDYFWHRKHPQPPFPQPKSKELIDNPLKFNHYYQHPSGWHLACLWWIGLLKLSDKLLGHLHSKAGRINIHLVRIRVS